MLFYVLATAIWMNGQITGNLNDDDLTGERVSTYVAIDDSRTYTAVGKIPPKTGYPLQMAVSLGELMGWLFAHGGSVNGFDITGMVTELVIELISPDMCTIHHLWILEICVIWKFRIFVRNDSESQIR